MFKSIRQTLDDWRAEDSIRQELSGLSDRDLNDIGIRRHEIGRIAREHVAMKRQEAAETEAAV